MRIIYLADDFLPYGQSSAAVLTYRLAKAFKARGQEVFIISRTDDKKNEGWTDYQGLKIYFIYSKYPSFLHNYLSLINPQTIFKVKKIFKELKPDVVHFQHIHRYLSYYCFKLAKRYSRAVFLTAHDTMLFSYGKFSYFIDKKNLAVQNQFNYRISYWQVLKQSKKRFNPLRNIIIKRYVKYLNRIITISDTLKQALADNNISNAETICNSIDLNDYQVTPEQLNKINQFKSKYNLAGKKVILFGGRISRGKGGKQIIWALSHVIKTIPNAILLVVGTQSGYWGNLQVLIDKLNLKDKVIATGWVDPSEMILAYYSADLCVTPSIYLDPFNLFNIEAMAAKKSVVGTCFGGTPEIVIDNQTGYIVNPYNSLMMAEKIIDLLNNDQKAKAFGQAGYARVEKLFSLENQVQKTWELYNKFVK